MKQWKMVQGGWNLLFTLDGTKRSDVVPWDVTLVAAGQVPSAPPVWVSGNSNKNVPQRVRYVVGGAIILYAHAIPKFLSEIKYMV